MAESKSYRLHPILIDMIDRKALDIDTSKTYIIEVALTQFFGDELRQRYPDYRAGMPYKRRDKEVEK